MYEQNFFSGSRETFRYEYHWAGFCSWRYSTQLFEDLSAALADGTLARLRRKLIKVELFIIDDFGLGGIDPSLGPSLLEIIDLQSNHGALLLTSQFPTIQWYMQFNDPTKQTQFWIESCIDHIC